MLPLSILTAAFIGLAASQPSDCQRTPPTKYYGISLNINMEPLGQQPVYGRAPVELNMLAQYTVNASQIIFDQGVHVNLNLDTVLCQAYSDEDGVKPLGGGPFSRSQSLELGQEPVPLGAVLCYVSGDR